jgi:ATP-dependent DNA helicase RecQ
MLAKRASVEQEVVRQYLNKLVALHVINYLPQKRTPMVVFFEERLDKKSIYISRENYQTRRERYEERANAILNYARKNDRCRSQVILEYFGELNSPPCGECDVCREKNETRLNQDEFRIIRDDLIGVIALEPISLESLIEKVPVKREKLIEVLQWMMDNNLVKFNDDQLLIKTS